MSELGDTIAALESHQAQLDSHEAKLARQEAKLSEHDRALGVVNDTEKHMLNLIDLLRDEVREGFRRMRAGINGAE